jgi:uncharacterized membrane protein
LNKSILATLAKILFAGLFVTAGITHFVTPAPFVAIVPPALPAKALLVYVSGALEILLGVLLLVPKTSRLAAWGLFALLLAIYPANIYMAVSGGLTHPDLPESFSNPVLAWGRLPVQFVLLYWAWRYTRKPSQ